MSVWIEVSSEYRFKKKLDRESGLYAPARTRHINQMRRIKPGDFILHYITLPGAILKENGSTIIGISIVNSPTQYDKSRITIDLKDIMELPLKITIKEIKSLEKKSKKLRILTEMNFQRYIAEITNDDAKMILKIHPENIDYIKNIKSFHDFLT